MTTVGDDERKLVGRAGAWPHGGVFSVRQQERAAGGQDESRGRDGHTSRQHGRRPGETLSVALARARGGVDGNRGVGPHCVGFRAGKSPGGISSTTAPEGGGLCASKVGAHLRVVHTSGTLPCTHISVHPRLLSGRCVDTNRTILSDRPQASTHAQFTHYARDCFWALSSAEA